MPQPVQQNELVAFTDALAAMPRPRGRQLVFLCAHAKAKGRALTMGRIAEVAGYKSYRGANLQYGLLADRIGRRLRRQKEGFKLLVEVIPPKRRSRDEHISNEEYILVMRPIFAEALERVGWI